MLRMTRADLTIAILAFAPTFFVIKKQEPTPTIIVFASIPVFIMLMMIAACIKTKSWMIAARVLMFVGGTIGYAHIANLTTVPSFQTGQITIFFGVMLWLLLKVGDDD